MATDIAGEIIEVGDTVAFGLAGTMTLHTGTVTKLNKKTVKIEGQAKWPNQWNAKTEWQRAFNDVVVIKREG